MSEINNDPIDISSLRIKKNRKIPNYNINNGEQGIDKMKTIEELNGGQINNKSLQSQASLKKIMGGQNNNNGGIKNLAGGNKELLEQKRKVEFNKKNLEKTIKKENYLDFNYDKKYWLVATLVYMPILGYIFYVAIAQLLRIMTVFFIDNDFSLFFQNFLILLLFLTFIYTLTVKRTKLKGTILGYTIFSILKVLKWGKVKDKKNDSQIELKKSNIPEKQTTNSLINKDNSETKTEDDNIKSEEIPVIDNKKDLDEKMIRYDILLSLIFFVLLYISSLIFHAYYAEASILNSPVDLLKDGSHKSILAILQNIIPNLIYFLKQLFLLLSVYGGIVGTYIIGYIYLRLIQSEKDDGVNMKINSYYIYTLTLAFGLIEMAGIIYVNIK